MVRISDILKKKIQASTPTSETEPTSPSQVIPTKESTPQPRPQKLPEMQIAKVMKELKPDIGRSNALYSQAVQLGNELLRSVAEEKPIGLQAIKDLVGEVINCLVLGDKTLVNLFYQDYSAEDYLSNHMVNAMVMSVDVGLGLGYNKSQLAELGLAAFLHDIGMVVVKDIALQPRRLSKEEYNKIKEHPVYGATIFSKLKDFPLGIIHAIQEAHERINGGGYPKGLKDQEITEYARIIAIVDIYEALTHSRTYRKKYLPHEAIKEILTNSSSLFDHAILKILINRVGIYPIGSWVELNTNEIGKVITTYDEFPLRPVVNLIFDTTGNRLDEARAINLEKQFNLFIKRPLSDEEVLRKIKEEVKDEESY